MKLKLSNTLIQYLLYTGIFWHLLLAISFVYLQRTEYLTSRQVIVKAFEHFNIDQPLLLSFFQSDYKYLDVPFDGVVKKAHPRIVFPELANWDERDVLAMVSTRIAGYQAQGTHYSLSCGSDSLMSMVVCWLTTHDPGIMPKLKSAMQNFNLNKPTADTIYSNGWELALAYDLTYSVLNESERTAIEAKILIALNATLRNLDEDFASLWHGRSTHAAIAWICAIVLSDKYIDDLDVLQKRAQAHFLTAIDGLAYTEIWPDGYNYWIQTRAFYLALASSAYINGLVDSSNQDKIKNIMRRVGYWHIYATRPDNRIEGFGDEGSRVDLKDETQRVIDLIVQITKDPVLAGYSKYLTKLHSDSYYSGYRWGVFLFNNPSIPSLGDGSLKSLGSYLKKSEIFGKNSTNYVYLRTGWNLDDTFISFKAGHSFGHHAHYDAGHFTIFKGSPLATNSSAYPGFFSEHRLNYAIRTIAKNSLLILEPNEKVMPNRHFMKNVVDGGQRLTLPTGSAILSVGDWLNNYQQGRHLEGAELINFSAKESQYYYISSDLTQSYNNSNYDENGGNGKVSLVRRQLLYLPTEDQLIIFDKINSTNSKYVKKWLLHSVNKPKVDGVYVLKGEQGNGILESKSNVAEIQNGVGFLKIKNLLAENSLIRLIGGKDYQYYVESDGDEAIFDGENFNQDAISKPWNDVSMWRLEIQPQNAELETDFLVSLSPTLNKISTQDVFKVNALSGDAYGVATGEVLVVFINDSNEKDVVMNLPEGRFKIIILGSTMYKNTRVEINDRLVFNDKPVDGVIFIEMVAPVSGNIRINLN